MPLASRTRLGPYEIVTLLGAGGMGEVYRGRDTRLGRDVALKVISPELVGNASSRHRFEREARAASALNHPAIVTVYDVGETDGTSWIAMEWVDGRTLRAVLAQGPLSIDESWSFARQIADGLAAAHARGVVHRDLKPENVMVASDGRVRILDFGLARHDVPVASDTAAASAETVEAFSPAATMHGAIMGTVGYMSPEQAAGRAVDFRSDQFAFGLVLYEMLSGRRAFAHATTVETLWATMREQPEPLTSLRPEIPDTLHAVVARCLAKKPEERFASTRDLVAALAGGEVAPVAVPQPVATPAPTRASLLARAKVPVAIAGVAVVVALAAFIWKGITGARSIDSVVVLPFVTTASDVDVSYLGDELTDSLIDQLTRIRSLKVIARTTAFRYKGERDLRKIKRDLEVAAVLTGTVSRRGNQLTISAELVDPSNDKRLWGQTYNQSADDLMSVQDAIATAVSTALMPNLSGEDKRAIGGHGTTNPEAYELFLKGRYAMIHDTEEDDREALALFQKAVEKDPRYVDAHLGIVVIHVRSAGNGYARPKDAWASADRHLDTVRAIAPGEFGIRVHMATRRFMYDWDWPYAEREFLAIKDDPQLLLQYRYHPAAMFLWARGWANDAADLMERALRVDPGNLESRVMRGDFLFQAGRLDEAIAYYRAIVEVAPEDARPYFGLAEALKRKADITGAIATLRKAYELWGEDEPAKALVEAKSEGDFDAVQTAVAKARVAELHELARDRYVSPIDFARLYAQAGEADKAFQYLDLALEARSPSLVFLRVDRAWDPVRSDPRFLAAVRRVGIP